MCAAVDIKRQSLQPSFLPNKPCSLKCPGTQLHSTRANSLSLNKWAIDFCLFSEQPGAFWMTIVSSIKKKYRGKKKSWDSKNALSLLIRLTARLSGPIHKPHSVSFHLASGESGVFLAFLCWEVNRIFAFVPQGLRWRVQEIPWQSRNRAFFPSSLSFLLHVKLNFFFKWKACSPCIQLFQEA